MKVGDLAIYYTHKFALDTWDERNTIERLIEYNVVPKIGQIVRLRNPCGSDYKADIIFSIDCPDMFDWDYCEKCFRPLTNREEFLYYTQGIDNVNDM